VPDDQPAEEHIQRRAQDEGSRGAQACHQRDYGHFVGPTQFLFAKSRLSQFLGKIYTFITHLSIVCEKVVPFSLELTVECIDEMVYLHLSLNHFLSAPLVTY
jgi:hypothetical protein